MQEAGLSSFRRGLGLAALVLALVVGALLLDTLFGSKVLSQSDALFQFAPWSDAAVPEASPPSNPVLLDQSIVMQPWQHFAAERLHNGTPPLWNPNNYLGQPMVGTYQTAYFWPLNWLYYVFPTWSFLAWSAALRLFAAGLFTFLFLRRLALGVAPSILGAVTFALSGFMIAWLGHLHTHVALFLPAFFWMVERTAERPTLRNNGLVALFVGCALVAGHLQTAVHIAIAVAAYSAFRFAVPVRGTQLTLRGLSQLAAGAILGVMFAMPQLLPFFDYLGTSSGASVLEHLDTVAKVAPLDAAVLSIDPGHFGSPAVAQGYGSYTGPSGANVNYNELIGGYVGRVALLLALVGAAFALFRRRRTGPAALFFVALALFAAAVAWQVWPVYDFMAAIPKLKSTKLMRFSLLLAFSLSTLAAFGLAVLTEPGTFLNTFNRRSRDGVAVGHRSKVFKNVPGSVSAGFVVAAVALELLAFGRGYNPALDPARLAPPTAVTDYLREQLPVDGSPATWRALGIDNTILLPSANLYYDIPMVSGYDSMETRTTTELVALMSSDPRGQYFIKEIRQFDQAWQIGALLGVRYVLSPIELPAPLELVLDGPTKIYANPAALPRAFAASRVTLIADAGERLAHLGDSMFDPHEAVLEREPLHVEGLDFVPTLAEGQAADLTKVRDPDSTARAAIGLLPADIEIDEYSDLEVRLTVDVGGTASVSMQSLVVLTDAWDAGWQAELDGKPVPIERVDHALRGVFVPPGRHELVFRYQPPAILVGLSLGAIGLLGILAMLFLPDREKTAGPKPPALF
jgi:hypothetical protein